MVRQGAPGEELHWSTPGGRAEAGELVTEALVREVREETGVRVLDAGRLAFVKQIDDRRPVQLHESFGPRSGFHVTVWTFEVSAWEGEVAPADPDALVREAAFVPLADAVAHLEQIAWQSTTAQYLRGDIPPASVWLERRHRDGTAETVARLP